MSKVHLNGIQKQQRGVETLPNKKGEAKTCISGQSYVCGRACLGIGSSLTPNCNRGLNPLNIRKARSILNVLKSIKEQSQINQERQTQNNSESQIRHSLMKSV